MKPRLILADDHALVLDAIANLLASEFNVIATVTDGCALLEVASRERPDAVVLDIMMPSLNGLDAARRLRSEQPDVRIVFLTMMEDPAIAAEALKLGKCGYVLKRSAASELVAALHQVLRKRTYMTPLITGEVLGALDAADPAERGSGQPLTARQRQVLQLLAQGHSMKQVAKILRLAPGTVAFHKYRIMEHFHIHSSAQLVQFAVRHHLD